MTKRDFGWWLTGWLSGVGALLLTALLWPDPDPTFHAVRMSPDGWRIYYGAPGDSVTTELLSVPRAMVHSDSATVLYRLPAETRAGPWRLHR